MWDTFNLVWLSDLDSRTGQFSLLRRATPRDGLKAGLAASGRSTRENVGDVGSEAGEKRDVWQSGPDVACR